MPNVNPPYMFSTTWKDQGNGTWGSAPASFDYAPYPLEIIQPQAGLDTKNRFYKTYTGIEYNVKVSVFGGRFDTLSYSLTTAPSGMTINSSTGEIVWSNPVEAGSPHTITAEVTDGNTTDAVTWTLTVDTNNALFLDSTVGTAGVGTIGDPMKEWTDFYGPTESDSTYQDHFVYFRQGTYVVDGNANTVNNGNQWGTQKPVVFIAHPGETVTQDFSQTYMFYDADGTNTYWDRMDAINVAAYSVGGVDNIFAFRVGGSNVTFRRSTWKGLADHAGSYNQSYIMCPAGTKRNYWSISENDFDGNSANGYASFVGYDMFKAVAESNHIDNMAGIGIGWKKDNAFCAARGNYLESTESGAKGLWAYLALDSGDFEYSWNFVDTPSAKPYTVNDSNSLPTGPVYAIRNSFTASTNYAKTAVGYPNYYETDNVVISSEPNNYTASNNDNPSIIVQDGNLVNVTETDFLDTSTRLLIGSYAGQNAFKGSNGMAGLK